jgi:threonine synthase
MDIQVSSNFERLLFDALDQDGQAVEKLMTEFRAKGSFGLAKARLAKLCKLFEGHRFDDEGTKAAIRGMYKLTGQVLDPHSAIGVAAGLEGHDYKTSTLVALATAHAAKFPDAVEAACGVRPALPRHMADLLKRPERCDSLPNDLAAVQAHIKRKVRA